MEELIMTFKSILTIALTLMTTSAIHAADIGKLTDSCTSCHGKDGASTDTNTPSIGGISAKVLNLHFKAYKAKERTCAEMAIKTGELKDTKTDMCKIVEALSDEDVKKLVTFYSAKKFLRATQTFDAALAEKGKEIHKTNCEKCHSEGGSLASDDASILAGQQKGYMNISLKEFLADKRPTEKKMKAKFEGLDKESIDALTNYYASFK
jgi:sulfide dehydrogenase cytochrome subunit